MYGRPFGDYVGWVGSTLEAPLLIKIAAGLAMLSVLVIIHEAGHMLVARFFKIGVPVFSIGMGPRIWGFTFKGTEYRFSLFPIGGYVQMAGADPFGEVDPDGWVDPDEDFMRKPVWQRLLVMFAGPAANLLLPLVLLSAVMILGESRPAAVVGMVLPDTPAYEAGVQAGDHIVAVNGDPVEIWSEVAEISLRDQGRPLVYQVERDGQRFAFQVPPHTMDLTPDGYIDLREAGISWSQPSSQVGVDDPGSPAAQAGLRTGDGIVAVDGQPVQTWDALLAALSGEVHELTYRRALARPKEGSDPSKGAWEERKTTLRADSAWAPLPLDPFQNPWGLAPVQVYVGGYVKDSAAEAAGVKLDDRILAVDGVYVRNWYDIVVHGGAAVPAKQSSEVGSGGCMGAPPEYPDVPTITLTIVRDGQLMDLAFKPKVTRSMVRAMVVYRPLLGIVQYPNAFVDGPKTIKSWGVTEAVPRAVDETAVVLGTTLGVLGQFFAGDREMKETIGGPVAIFDMAGESAEQGFSVFARMMAAISVGLGIINLLPVPVLDGGQIVFYAIEGLRGRPLSVALRERIQMVGVLFLVALILVVTVNDLSRVFTGG